MISRDERTIDGFPACLDNLAYWQMPVCIDISFRDVSRLEVEIYKYVRGNVNGGKGFGRRRMRRRSISTEKKRRRRRVKEGGRKFTRSMLERDKRGLVSYILLGPHRTTLRLPCPPTALTYAHKPHLLTDLIDQLTDLQQ